jgi:hypothetical protein
LIPVLYLKGISMGDFQEALSAIMGPDAPNLSPGCSASTSLSGGDNHLGRFGADGVGVY